MAPPRSGLLNFESIKVPTYDHAAKIHVNDIPSFMESTQGHLFAHQVTADIRSALVHTDHNDIQPRLWRNRNNAFCDVPNLDGGVPAGNSQGCGPREVSSEHLEFSKMERAFVSPLPVTYSTGTRKQYAPRMQSSVTLSETSLPDECNPESGNPYYVSYSAPADAERNWTITACILEDSRDIIQPKYDAQTFRETAYFAFDFPDIYDTIRTTEVTVETKMGYFELPSAANYEEPGPLLETSPFGPFGRPCQTRDCEYGGPRSRRRDLSRNEGRSQASFQDTDNKGPLGYFTDALFGHGSYIHMQNYTSAMPQSFPTERSQPTIIGRRPLYGLVSSTITLCSHYINDTDLSTDPGTELSCFASLFLDDTSITEQMLRAAIFLTSDAIMLKPVERPQERLGVSSDAGTVFIRPRMSTAGLFALSILHGLVVAALLILSLDTTFRHNWTPELDTLTLMRVGAELGLRNCHFRLAKGMIRAESWMS